MLGSQQDRINPADPAYSKGFDRQTVNGQTQQYFNKDDAAFGEGAKPDAASAHENYFNNSQVARGEGDGRASI